MLNLPLHDSKGDKWALRAIIRVAKILFFHDMAKKNVRISLFCPESYQQMGQLSTIFLLFE